MYRAFAIAMLSLAFASSGCVDDSGASAASTSSAATSEAPPATVDAVTGAIEGVAIDDEQRPIAGVKVAILEAEAEATTDAEGRFSFSELEPAKYKIIAERLGYESAGVSVDVIAGEVAEVKLTLKALVIIDAYTYSIPRVALMHASVTLINTLTNESALNTLSCDPCRFSMHLPKNPAAVMSEGRWNPTPAPVINAALNLQYNKGHSATSSGTSVCLVQPNVQPFQRLWSQGCNDAAQKTDTLFLIVMPGPVPGLISVEHRVEVWTSFAYGEEFPEGFTALPPP